jgi:RNA polymerase sigma factor (TIGR02999 family)
LSPVPDPGMRPITNLLLDWRRGNRAALDQLLPLVYEELRRIAQARLRQEAVGHTIQATALVHEAYVRLVDLNRLSVTDRTHFFAIAARLMRQILVDHARRRLSDKRGGGQTLLTLEGIYDAAAAAPPVDLLDLDRALDELGTFDERLARVVELRFFVGLTLDEAAEALDVSHATIERDWAVAKAWLFRRLTPGTLPVR